MSDLPRISPDVTDFTRLRIAAAALSVVMALFISYWTAYVIHAAIGLLAPQSGESPVVWAFSIACSILVGIGLGAGIFDELERHLDT